MIFNVKIAGKRILFVGGGNIAERKIKKLIEESPKISVIAPEVTDFIKNMGKEGRVEIIEREIRNDDLTGDFFMVICATDRPEVNEKISNICRNLGILHDDISNHENSDIMMAATTVVGELTISISTNGNDPSAAKQLKNDLENDLISNNHNFEKYIKMIYNKKM